MVDLQAPNFSIGPTYPKDIFRPIRVALVYLGNDAPSLSSLHALFDPLNVQIFSLWDLHRIDGQGFDLIGVLGETSEKDVMVGLRKMRFGENNLVAFQPRERLAFAKELLKSVDSVILCESGASTVAGAQPMQDFLQSLVYPSLLNIDLADVHSISKGIGLLLTVCAQSSEEIISKLPGGSYFAKSALLHFSCAEDVSLREIYEVSKAIAIKRENADTVDTAPDYDKTTYRKINVKIGLRLLEGEKPQHRIKLNALLFGL